MTGHNNSRTQDLIDLRRKAIIDYQLQGITTVRELADKLGVSKSLIHNDIVALRTSAYNSLSEYCNTTLPHEIQVQLQGLDRLIAKSWDYINNPHSDVRTVQAAQQMIKDFYKEKRELIAGSSLLSKLIRSDTQTNELRQKIEQQQQGQEEEEEVLIK